MRVKLIDYPDSPNITKEEITVVSNFLKKKKLLPENTRLRKLHSGDFEILIASAEKDPSKSDRDLSEDAWTLDVEPVKGKKLSLRFGDHAREMATIAAALQEAKTYAANNLEQSMQGEYVKSFKSGSMNAHVESQRHWIHDKGPAVECNIGFIEVIFNPRTVMVPHRTNTKRIRPIATRTGFVANGKALQVGVMSH